MLPKVREFQPQDVTAVGAMLGQVPDGWSAQSLQDSLANQAMKSYVLCVENKVVAFCSFLVADDAELVFICTHPDHLRQGYAQILLDEGLSRTQKNSFVLEVRKSNIQAQNLYEKFGFTCIGTRKNFYTKPQEDALIYKLALLAFEE